MFPFREFLDLIFDAIRVGLANTSLLLIVGVLGYFIYSQYRRMSQTEQRMFGVALNPPGEQFVRVIWTGLAGGIIATFLFVFVGITLPWEAILYLWVLSLLFALVQPRFLCFAYSGGVLALGAVLFGFPFHVGSLMALVGVLHLVEAVLIRLQGGKHTTPVYVRRADGRVVGGFLMQKFWPIPFVALLAALVPANELGLMVIETPDWWPLIGAIPDPVELETLDLIPVLGLQLVFATLGYGDIALTSTPQQKARRTSRHLFLYSVVLLILAFLADLHWAWALVAALFSPLAHEWVIWAGRRSEEREAPIYTGEHGATVLAVAPGSPAAAMGLQTGDVILTVNGVDVHNRFDVAQALSPWAFEVEMRVRNTFGGDERVVRYRGRVPPLGILFAPEAGDVPLVTLSRPGFLVRMWRRLQRRLSA